LLKLVFDTGCPVLFSGYFMAPCFRNLYLQTLQMLVVPARLTPWLLYTFGRNKLYVCHGFNSCTKFFIILCSTWFGELKWKEEWIASREDRRGKKESSERSNDEQK
jgi:hypothetical protein